MSSLWTSPNAFFRSIRVTTRLLCFCLAWLIRCDINSVCSIVPEIPLQNSKILSEYSFQYIGSCTEKHKFYF